MMIIPLIPALSLALPSFICSAFVILRIILPILPPSPLSRRVPPSEFGLPNFRALSAADKSHIWLASLDLLALSIFIWQAISESLGGPSHFIDPASSARLWFALTVRQTCLFFVAGITLFHVRSGRPVSFGTKHWLLWTPTLLVVIFSTSVTTALAGANIASLFIGLIAYSSTIAVLTTFAIVFLMMTLFDIKRNLAALNDKLNPWPPMKQVEEKPRPSFATEDVDALRDGASWITSTASSRRNSVSAWSFSTHHTVPHQGFGSTNPAIGSHPSIPAKSSFWFTSSASQNSVIPPVPPLPSPYRSRSPQPFARDHDPDPFRRDLPAPHPLQRLRNGSQTSWLTSPSASQVTLSAWSYPTSYSHSEGHDLMSPACEIAHPVTPSFADARVLGGYGYTVDNAEVEKGLSSLAVSGNNINVSVYRAVPWLVMVWVPFCLSLPYLTTAFPNFVISSPMIAILLVLSVTISSPFLALNLLFRYPIPIPSGLFEPHSNLPIALLRTPSPASSFPGLPSGRFSHEYKRSGSVTVVESRRSDDVWIANGDAVKPKNRVSRAFGMMVPKPRLAMLPPKDESEDADITPPLPIQTEDTSSLALSTAPASEKSAEMGKLRRESRASSHFSNGDDNVDFASRIMIAQRHYSALAQTVIVPDRRESAGASQILDVASTTGFTVKQTTGHSGHLRTRSVASVTGSQVPNSCGTNISPPPSFPLPPTPPNVRAARLAQLGHKKSFSSGFSFGAVDDINEIDALTAGVLPLLVPGLKIGADMRVKRHGEGVLPPVAVGKSKKLATLEFGRLADDNGLYTPQVHSTPARGKAHASREQNISGRRKNHFSLPSLGLGKDGAHSLTNWKEEISRALESQIGRLTGTGCNSESGKRNTVLGTESALAFGHLQAVQGGEESLRPLKRVVSTRSLGLIPDVPHNVDTARSSAATLTAVPPSAASTVTLFDPEAGLESSPEAESTPHHTLGHKQVSKLPPTSSRLPKDDNTITRPTRRPGVMYIKSNDTEVPSSNRPSTTIGSSRPSQAILPTLRRQISNSRTSPATKPDSPRGGLRPLTLLKDRDTNAGIEVHVHDKIPPLSVGKKNKRRPLVVNDENAGVDPDTQNKNLKPLQLVRSETSKMRGILRKKEVLPDVVVRPPSSSEHTSFAYTFAI